MQASVNITTLLPDIALIVFALAFVAALVYVYARLWLKVVGNTQLSRNQRLAIRIGLPLVAWLFGAFMGFTSLYTTDPDTVWIYASICVFTIAFPVLDYQLSLGEYLVRCAGLFVLWQYAHFDNIFSLQNLLVSAGLLALFVLIRKQKTDVRYRLWACMGAGAYVAFGYWLTLPNHSLTEGRLYLDIGMYLLMTLVTCRYWVFNRDQQKKVEREDSLDLTSENIYASYARNIASLFDSTNQNKQPLTMAVIDIDHFTDVNERYGHIGANEILEQVVALIQTVLGQYSTEAHLYRAGGEEFTIMFVNTTPLTAAPIVLDCWDTIRSHTFTYGKDKLSLTISAGLSQRQGVDKNVDVLYTRAAASLRQSKRNGRDAITVEKVPQYAKEAKNWLPNYTYFVQPIIDARTTPHKVLMNELLLREYDRNRWMLPENFEIATATQISLIKRVLNHNKCHSVTVNLTAKQFSEESIAEAFIHFKKHEPRLDTFVIEIMDAPSLEIVEKITKMYHDAGIEIYLDDVGSDNSYELVLNMFPYLDGIKFAVQNLRKTNNSSQLQERISFWKQIADKNHLAFILEGVETTDESSFAFNENGIFRQQGYLFSKPILPQDEPEIFS